ncbi:MAG: hypothetical protein AB4426_25855 [Xenococcaceae cyanobacterium]
MMITQIERYTSNWKQEFKLSDIDPLLWWSLRTSFIKDLSQAMAILCVLSALSDHLTPQELLHNRDLHDFANTLAKLGSNLNYVIRRLVIHILGNFQYLTPEIAKLYFDSCRDRSVVFQEAKNSVSKFKLFSKGNLSALAKGVRSRTPSVMQNAAILLGELGISRSEELGREGRKIIADELVEVLKDPISEQTIYDLTKLPFAEDGKHC